MKYTLVNEVIRSDYSRKLMEVRGVSDYYSFLNPEEKHLQSPYQLDNLAKATEVLIQTLKDKDSVIYIVPDSDTDGLTSATIIWQYIKKISPNHNLQYFIHENKEHGLQDCVKFFEELIDKNERIDLIILPDAGSNDFEYFERLQNIKIIVLDHHETEKREFANVTIVNNQLSENYKNKALTGAGVTWQFCRALDYDFSERLEFPYSNELIDLAAVGIIADLQSVINLENRYIIKTGLSNIKNIFLQELINKQSYSVSVLNPQAIGFYIAPLINAMIRVGTKHDKEKLFLAFIKGEEIVPSTKRGAKGETETRAVQMARECTNAKNRQENEKKRVLDNIEIKILNNDLLNHKMLFIRLEEEDVFPATLNGLIAMQLSQKYRRPTLVGRYNPNDGIIKGSARGLNDSDLISLKDFLESTELFEFCEGHANAHGFGIKNSKLTEFHEISDKTLAAYDFGETSLRANFIFNSGEDIAEMIYELEPLNDTYGTENNEPLVVVENIHLNKASVSIIGQNRNTAKFDYNGITYIMFFAKDFIEEIENSPNNFDITVAGTPGVNHYNGRTIPQIRFKYYEIKPSSLYEF